MYNSITTRSLIPSFFTSMLMVYIYMSHSSQRKMKQKKKMNISHLAHISISIFCRCSSLLFSVDAASYFLVGRHRLSFLCPGQKVQKKKHKKMRQRERETTHFFPYVCLRLVSWSSEHTHSVFSLVSRRISSERTKKPY